jgi:hypothetical protein
MKDMEIIWRLQGRVLDTEARVRPLIEQLQKIPGFQPAQYDLNQKEQWRGFDLDRTVVDALTQRTQLVRIRGENGRSLAVIALGKRGPEPTAVIRLDADVSPSESVSHWEELVEEAPVRASLLTSNDWQDRIEATDIDWSWEDFPPALVCGWRRDSKPDNLETALEAVPTGTPVRLEQHPGFVALWLAPEGEIEGTSHQQALRILAERGLEL